MCFSKQTGALQAVCWSTSSFRHKWKKEMARKRWKMHLLVYSILKIMVLSFREDVPVLNIGLDSRAGM